MGIDLPDCPGGSHRQHPHDEGSLLGHTLQGHGRQKLRGGCGIYFTGNIDRN